MGFCILPSVKSGFFECEIRLHLTLLHIRQHRVLFLMHSLWQAGANVHIDLEILIPNLLS